MTVYQAKTLENDCSLKIQVRQMLVCLTIDYTPAALHIHYLKININDYLTILLLKIILALSTKQKQCMKAQSYITAASK